MKRKTREQRRRIQDIALVVATVAMFPVLAVLMVKSLDHPGEQHINGNEYMAQIAQYAPAEPVVMPTVAQREFVEPVKLYDVPLDEELQQHIIAEAEAHGIDPLAPMVTEQPELEWKEWVDKKTGRKKRQPLWFYKALADSKTPEERAKIRSKTFPGIAKAIGEQWGGECNA